jgi:hypothetical protein
MFLILYEFGMLKSQDCYFDNYHSSMLQTYRYDDVRDSLGGSNPHFVQFTQNQTNSAAIYSPVVFQMLCDPGSNKFVANAQVMSQLAALNNLFSNLSNYEEAPNTNIRFCLANTDPDMNYGTGINRIVTTKQYFDLHSLADIVQLKALIHWNPDKFLNISVTDLANS